MKVKITACNNPSRWYADMIGITVPAVSYNSDGNYICDLGIISDKDCVVVSDEKVFSMDKTADPNALAWKGTPGPWHTNVTRRGVVVQGAEQIVCVTETLNPHIAHANAHMISAAPEAIEFIADLVENLECFHALDHPYWIARAEEILKKAYNH